MKTGQLITFLFQEQERQGILLNETNVIYDISGYLYPKDEVQILAAEEADPTMDMLVKQEARIVGLEARLQQLTERLETSVKLTEELAKLTTKLAQAITVVLENDRYTTSKIK